MFFFIPQVYQNIKETGVNHKYSTKVTSRSKFQLIVKKYIFIYFDTGSGAVIDYKEHVLTYY